MSPQTETWHISQRLNELLIDDIKEEYFSDTPVSKGRTVGEQLAHLHNVRLMWLKVAAPDLFASQRKLEKDGISKKSVLAELKRSADAIGVLLETSIASGRIKGFKPHAQAFLGYLIAHEAHHRGQILLALKQNGHLPDKKTLYGLWEWGSH